MGARHRRGLRGIPQGGLDAPDDGRHREGIGRLPLTIAKDLWFFEFVDGVTTSRNRQTLAAVGLASVAIDGPRAVAVHVRLRLAIALAVALRHGTRRGN